ncbi:hypothetical protein GCM10007863_30470 [Dyella mobilis]|nr:hypothetical protein GCM10007863_30470 [Dyella mobilis]
MTSVWADMACGIERRASAHCTHPTHPGPARYNLCLYRPLRLPVMQAQDPTQIAHLLAELRQEHRDLDAAIEKLVNTLGCDELQITRMKKRKLLLKDTIARLESRLIPDLDA